MKPIEAGCLAIVVGTQGCDCEVCGGNRGKIVRVVDAMYAGDTLGVSGGGVLLMTEFAWLCQTLGGRLLLDIDRDYSIYVTCRPFLEHQLRRIDDPVGADETLTWAPVPTTLEKINAPHVS